MRSARPSQRWLLCLAGLFALLPTDARSQTVRVPVAPPSITLLAEGEPEPVWREPRIAPADEITLTNLATPENAREAVEVLRAALSSEYLGALMRSYGYRTSDPRFAASRRKDLRTYDLARLLFDRWVFADPQSRLAKEFSCLSSGEFDIGVFLTLLVVREYSERYDEARGWRLPSSSRRVARAAELGARMSLVRCERLVELGDISLDEGD